MLLKNMGSSLFIEKLSENNPKCLPSPTPQASPRSISEKYGKKQLVFEKFGVPIR
jgi:hypothetical protein